MKFRALREKCEAKAWRLIVEKGSGKTELCEVHTLYTVEPKRKLSKWDEAEVAGFTATVTKWPVGYVSTVEVKLRV